MKKLTKMIVGAWIALLLATSTFAASTPTTVNATNAPDAWVLTLSGVGSTATTGDKATGFGVDLSIGRTGNLLLPLEAGFRQSVSYANSDTVASTKLYADWTLVSYKKLDWFAGANVGASYGNTPLTWSIAPETGLRYWLKRDVALYGRAEFPFNMSDGRFNETIRYTLGVQFKF